MLMICDRDKAVFGLWSEVGVALPAVVAMVVLIYANKANVLSSFDDLKF